MTTVSFGGVPADNVFVQSDSQIACTAPAHAAGDVAVTVTNELGTGPAYTFTYLADAPASAAPVAWLPWMDPVYYVRSSGTKTIDTAPRFDNAAGCTFSLQGSPPAAATINSSTGVVSINTAADLPWSTLTVRATNGYGHADLEVEVWVFTPTHVLTNGASFSSISPAPGDIIAVRSATYTTPQQIGAWSGTGPNPTRIVVYPGDHVILDSTNLPGQGDQILNMARTSTHDLEIRGFEFVDNNRWHYMALWTGNAMRITLAQNEVHGFYWYSFTGPGDISGVSNPWRIEYNRLHDNCQGNNPPSESTIWGTTFPASGINDAIIRRNRIWHSWGEGVIVGGSNVQVLQNIVANCWSICIYPDCAYGTQIHGNICWMDEMAYVRYGPGQDPQGRPPYVGYGRTIVAANEGGGTCDAIVATNNYIYHLNDLPYFDTFAGGTGGSSVWAPNYDFQTIDPRWLQ